MPNPSGFAVVGVDMVPIFAYDIVRVIDMGQAQRMAQLVQGLCLESVSELVWLQKFS